MLFLYYILHGIKKLEETGFDELEVDETAVDVPGPHLLFPSHLPSSSVHCLTFLTSLSQVIPIPPISAQQAS